MSTSIGIIGGAGYVGLTTGICLAEMGHTVYLVDIDEEKIKQLKQGNLPIYEPGLKEMMEKSSKENRLFFTTSYQEMISQCLACFICVDTPISKDGQSNLNHVKSAAKEIALHLSSYRVIIVKSTAPVGTVKLVEKIIQENIPEEVGKIEFDVISNPEFLKEGTAVTDCMKPDRIVIGSDSSRATEIMKSIYAPFMHSHDRLQVMDAVSAELTKYACNAMLATRISFMNELAGLCEKVGADISLIRKGMGADKRIGYDFLYAGLGYGGSCLPKDIRTLLSFSNSYGHHAPLLEAVDVVNTKQKKLLGYKMIQHFNELENGIRGKTIAILGLSFKPDTDDMRDAISPILIEQLLMQDTHLRLFDPIAMEKAKQILPTHNNITWCTSELEAAFDADGIALVTEWKQFRFLNFKKILEVMKGKALFDGRNQYDPEHMHSLGFDYYCIGKTAKLQPRKEKTLSKYFTKIS